MALRFLESFDNYGFPDTGDPINDQLIRKWQMVFPESGGTIELVPGQTDGGSAAKMQATENAQVTHIFGSQPGTLIVGFWWKFLSSPVNDTNEFVRLRSGNNTGLFHIGLELTSTNVLRITRQGSILATGTTTLVEDTWYFIEIKATPANSGGTADVRINRNVEISFTGDTSQDNTTTFSGVCFLGAFARIIYFDDIYILDSTGSTNNDYLEDGTSNAGGVRIVTLYPNGEGNSTELGVVRASDNYLAVRESAPDDDGTYVKTTQTARDTYLLDDLFVPVSDIYAVQNCIVHRKEGPGNKLISSMIRTGGLDFVSANTGVVSEYLISCNPIDQNPDTSADWTESDINSLEIGIDFFNPATFLNGTGTLTAVGIVNGAILQGTGTITATGTVTP